MNYTNSTRYYLMKVCIKGKRNRKQNIKFSLLWCSKADNVVEKINQDIKDSSLPAINSNSKLNILKVLGQILRALQKFNLIVAFHWEIAWDLGLHQMGEYKIPLHCFLSLMKHTLESWGEKRGKKAVLYIFFLSWRCTCCSCHQIHFN